MLRDSPGECSFPLQHRAFLDFVVALPGFLLYTIKYSATWDSQVGIRCCLMKDERPVGRLKRPRSKLREEAKVLLVELGIQH